MGTNVVRTSPLRTTVITAFVQPSTATTTEIVAAIANARIRVLSVAVMATLANTLNFESGTTDISPIFPLGANGGFVLPFNEHGWFETAAGAALGVTTGQATSTAVMIQYVRIPA